MRTLINNRLCLGFVVNQKSITWFRTSMNNWPVLELPHWSVTVNVSVVSTVVSEGVEISKYTLSKIENHRNFLKERGHIFRGDNSFKIVLLPI